VQLEQELAGFTSNRNCRQAVGVFDGVHMGHIYLILKLAEQQARSSVVITFDKHLQKILRPHSHPLYLIDAAEKAELLFKDSLDVVISLVSSLEISCASPCECVGF